MSYVIEKIYSKYFQKSRSFLLPMLGLKKTCAFMPIQSYLSWEDVYSIQDCNLILTYKVSDKYEWEKYLVETLMSNEFFNDYHYTDDPTIVVLSFDLNCIATDYIHVLEGQYSKLSKMLKKKIRDYYNYNSAEWAYMESFLFPDRYIPLYGKILDVEEEHIRFTGQLCDLPNLDKETLKLKLYAKINDVDQINMESRENI